MMPAPLLDLLSSAVGGAYLDHSDQEPLLVLLVHGTTDGADGPAELRRGRGRGERGEGRGGNQKLNSILLAKSKEENITSLNTHTWN